MTSDTSVQCGQGDWPSLPFFSRYDFQGSSGIDVFAHDVFVLLGTYYPAFGCCFPPPAMVGAIVQHLAECHARAVLVVPDVCAYLFSRVQRATVLSRLVAPFLTRLGVFIGPLVMAPVRSGTTRVGRC